MLHELAEVDQVLRRCRQRGVETLKDFAKDRHDFHEEENSDQNGHNSDDRRVHHCRFNLLAKASRVFQINGQPSENFRQQTAFFTSCNHASVKAIESFGMLLKRLRETVATFDASANVLN